MPTNPFWALVTIAGVSLADNQGRAEGLTRLDDEFASRHTMTLAGNIRTTTNPVNNGQEVKLTFNILTGDMDTLKATLISHQRDGTDFEVVIDDYPTKTFNARVVTINGLYNYPVGARRDDVIFDVSITVIKVS